MYTARVRQNYWANLLAALASFLLAAFWYGFFLDVWLRSINRTLDTLRGSGVPEWVPYLIAFGLSFVMATGISCVTQLLGPQTVSRGIRAGFLVWLGFIFTTLGIEYTYELRPGLFAINAGYWFLSAMVMGAIVGSWKKKGPARVGTPDHRVAAAAE